MSMITLGVGGVSTLDSLITSGLELGNAPTPFEALYPYLDVKLDNGILSLELPPLQTTSLTATVAGSTRITEALHTRVTRAGHTRVTRDYTITSRPERVALKLYWNIVNLQVLMTNVEIKLADNVETIHLPPLQSNSLTTTVAGSTRITEALHTRVTRGGNTRVTRDYTITARPEMAVVKLDNAVVTLQVGDERGSKARRRK